MGRYVAVALHQGVAKTSQTSKRDEEQTTSKHHQTGAVRSHASCEGVTQEACEILMLMRRMSARFEGRLKNSRDSIPSVYLSIRAASLPKPRRSQQTHMLKLEPLQTASLLGNWIFSATCQLHDVVGTWPQRAFCLLCFCKLELRHSESLKLRWPEVDSEQVHTDLNGAFPTEGAVCALVSAGPPRPSGRGLGILPWGDA